MDTFENVHVFSQTTAEISQEYIGKFHEAEIVPNYLHELSQKAGVELVSRDGVYEVKGSWLSVNRAHSFLGKFLLTYGQTRVDTVSLGPPEPSISQEEEDGLDFLNRKTFPTFTNPVYRKSQKEDVETPSKKPDHASHIDQHLPPDKILVAKHHKMPPEPVVLYAGYQLPTKEAESRRKTLEVLKNVYKMEQNYQIALTQTKGTSDAANSTEQAQTEGCEPEESNIQNEAEEHSKAAETELDDNHGNSSLPDEPAPDGQEKLITEIKEEILEKADTSTSRKRLCMIKTLSKEETAAKRMKVETIAKNILSNVPTVETVNVVSNEDLEKLPNDKKVAEVPETDEDVKHIPKVTEVVDQDPPPPPVEDDDDGHDDNEVPDDDVIEDEESDFKDDSVDKDYSGDTEVESADDGKMSASDNEYVPEEVVSLTKIKATTKRTTRRSKAREELAKPLPSTKRGRGRPRKGFPMKIEVKLPTKSSQKAELPKAKKKQLSGAQKRRGRPKRLPSEIPKEFHCDKCPYFANKRCHLREHERRVHITKEFKCEHCDKIFGFGKDLKRHLKTHLKPQNCCDICGKLYKGVKSLVEHRRTHEDGYIKPEFECEICKKNFSTKYVLAYHIKSEHLGMKRTYMCPTCGKSFSQKNSYLQHANVHMGFKPYKCEVCGKAFSYEKSLKEHRFMHDDIRRFKCPVCEKTFRQSSAVTIHMKVHKETKDYVCMACGKGFSQKQALIRHERIHLGEKPFSCGLCGRNFTDSSILRRHMILIHKKDPKKWREDTINNTVRRTDFFIDVLPGVGEEEQTGDVTIKEPEVHVNTGALNTPHPDLVAPVSSTSGSEPINMTTQSSVRDRDAEGYHGERQDVTGMEPERSAEHTYHMPISQVHSEGIQGMSHDSSSHIGDSKMSVPNHGVQTGSGLPHQGTLQGHHDPKSEGGEYLGGSLPAHQMSYSMMGQGGYPYPQMVMLPDPNVPFPPPSAAAYQPQFTDPGTSHQFTPYHPPQS
ncbi:zinc finger protein 37-like [Haliotis rufescens]|uniref:zinc finger protein 37-like n=1 Tax=Haliotis rufescens TaxID=6454 RepID=UPI00201ED82A|nr:zinc finger protein 37-like [Haliotis rufescens]